MRSLHICEICVSVCQIVSEVLPLGSDRYVPIQVPSQSPSGNPSHELFYDKVVGEAQQIPPPLLHSDFDKLDVLDGISCHGFH